MTLGIMGAMTEEVASILSHMQNIKEIKHGGRSFHQGDIQGKPVVLVFSRWGKVAAAATATALITEFGVTQLIFTGVAGATTADLAIGDVLISDKLYQHDMDARPIMPRYQIPLTGMTFFTAHAELIEKAQKAIDGLFASLTDKISAKTLTQFAISQPKCLIGTIATGDQFIGDRQKTEAIVREQPDTLAVEMEGAAVAQVCTDYDVPFVVIRTISDKADHTSEIDFPQFIEKVARHYSQHIISNMLKSD